ncbi:unnamed protein product, partial [Discosporangium mesarthrocarpum]
MNIMIPMGGLGSRFSKDGYRFPKPMVNIVGRPMLLWLMDNLQFTAEDTVWLGLPRSLAVEFAVEALLRREYPSLDIRIVFLDFQTRGAAETLFVILQHMAPEELQRRSISLDCDTIYFSDVLGDFRKCRPGCGASFYFTDHGAEPIYSYISFEEGTQRIKDIREKVAISCQANTGGYGFPTGLSLRSACESALDRPPGKAGEFYTSSLIKSMIAGGQEFEGIHVPRFSCVGTPQQLRAFLGSVRAGYIKLGRKVRFCFDLDRTLLLMAPAQGWGQGQGQGQGEGQGGTKLLEDFSIPYDEIFCGKPRADFYEGRPGADSLVDIEKEVGWLLEPAEGSHQPTSGFIQSRPFNRVIPVGDLHVVKSGPWEFMRGETCFYRSIPSTIQHLFPSFVEANDDPEVVEVPSITMTKVDGVSFSHLLANHCVTRGRFLKLLQGLLSIHCATPDSGKPLLGGKKAAVPATGTFMSLPAEALPYPPAGMTVPIRRVQAVVLPPSVLCANLHAKVLRRLHAHETVYASFSADGMDDCLEMAGVVLDYLKGYEAEGRCVRAAFVHGDPVFSNCLATKENEVVFVDMRGALGNLITTQGDINYDLSKVYQSLCGYDFVILDKEITARAAEILEDLKQSVFWPFVEKHYGCTSSRRDIQVLAASHFLSIVPLHDNRSHQRCFIKACKAIL